MYFFSAKGQKSFAEVNYPDRVYIVFGKEDTGLPEELIKTNIDRTLRIPMRPGVRCLNLSNSAAIAVYEILRQDGYDGMSGEYQQ